MRCNLGQLITPGPRVFVEGLSRVTDGLTLVSGPSDFCQEVCHVKTRDDGNLSKLFPVQHCQNISGKLFIIIPAVAGWPAATDLQLNLTNYFGNYSRSLITGGSGSIGRVTERRRRVIKQLLNLFHHPAIIIREGSNPRHLRWPGPMSDGSVPLPTGRFVTFKKTCHCNQKIINICQIYHLSFPIILYK